MVHWKRYFLLGLILLVALALKLNNWDDEYAAVEEFRGAALQEEVFYPLKAKNINEEGLLGLAAEGASYGISEGVYMGSSMNPLISLELAQELFGCSAKLYSDETLLLLYNEDIYLFEVGSPTLAYNDEEIKLSVAVEQGSSTAYLPLEDLCALLGCEYSYDEVNYQAIIAGEITKGDLPQSFDLRDYDRAAEVRDQGSDSTCWAQASIAALESSLLPFQRYSFSVSHMVSDNAFGVDSALGGDFTMAVAYLLSWEGPIKNSAVAKHVQEVLFFDQDDVLKIKWAVYQNGGVSTSIYTNVSNLGNTKSAYYNSSTNSYCYTGSEEPNHDVVIIGWDDGYSASNFSQEVAGDGAFICQNSWGEDFGENGVFYVSYYDTNICTQAVAYTLVEDTTNYDTIYQSDLCGWVGQIGFGKESIYAANVYTARTDEEIVAAGFYALGENTSYQVYFVSDYSDVNSLANRVVVASGTLSESGYYTISFDKGYQVEQGKKFAVIVVIETPDLEYPLAVEYAADEMTVNVDITDGEGYISINGLDWTRVEVSNEANLCLKAYGRKVE